MGSFWQDLRYGVRVLLKRPAFTVLCVWTVAIGIGVNTAIFSVVNAAFLRPLPYADPDRLVRIWETRTAKDLSHMEASSPNYVDWIEQNSVFEGLAGYDGTNFTPLGRGLPERVSGTRVTANFFSVLGVRPLLGRDYQSEDEASPVALISYQFWKRYFRGDIGAVGQSLNLSSQLYTVIGVLPPDFKFAPSGDSRVWVPLRVSDEEAPRNHHWLRTIGRLILGPRDWGIFW